MACLYSLTLKRIWEGQFQIVLNSEKESLRLNKLPIKNIISKSDSNLNTQVGILKSPSVLMPIYDFVISSKKLDRKDQVISFNSWKNNLDIQLEKDTSILNISYKDTDKKSILPVLKKMTTTYQEYSGRNEKRTQQLTKDYLVNQISFYKSKSSNSLKEAQGFAIDQDLIFNDRQVNKRNSIFKEGAVDNNSYIDPTFLKSNVGIEAIRANAANKIRLIDAQIEKILELGNDFEKIQYIGSTIPSLLKKSLPQNLAELDQELAEKKVLFTDNDPNIERIIERRDFLIKLLRERAIGYLKAERLEAEARMQSALRPKGVILKYKELLREAENDESTLIALENDLRIVELDQAKVKDPWQLITNPTLLKYPVGPKRTNIGLKGLLFGFFVGVISSYLKERKSGKIFESTNTSENFNSNLSIKLISRMILKSKDVLFLKKFIENQSIKNMFY